MSADEITGYIWSQCGIKLAKEAVYLPGTAWGNVVTWQVVGSSGAVLSHPRILCAVRPWLPLVGCAQGHPAVRLSGGRSPFSSPKAKDLPPFS